LDNSARIGLINAYLARATEYVTKDKNYEKAANDYRSSLFYLTYYTSNEVAQNSATTIGKVQNNLDACLNATRFDTSPENRFATAKRLRAEGEFAAAAYEFMQALGSQKLQKDSFEQIASIMKVIGNEPKAAEYYKKATAVAPNDLSARLAYAKILDNQNQSNEALREYGYVLGKAHTDNNDLLYSLERVFSNGP
jgi:tetratricopeptide (TPR) repeat protein